MAVVLGIDEAGRGPVLGPMVIGGVALEKTDEERLRKLGVKDSKMLSPSRREALAKDIRKSAKGISTVHISAKQLDELMQIMTINQVELNAMVQIINRLAADEVYIDLPSGSPSFIRELKEKIKNKNTKIVAEHKADAKYVSVGAASIIAKTERDGQVMELQKKYSAYGDIGSGYPADERTINFLKKYHERHGEFPAEVRMSWATVKNLAKKETKSVQKTLA